MTSSRSKSHGVVWVALLALLASVVSCAEERPPINQVQANALSKAFFVGALADPADDPEFYMHTSIVDAAYGAGADGLFTSSDAQPTVRIRWEITEKLLLARLTYELVDGTDGKGTRRTPDGQAVAAFTIEDHFDIRRDYNPTTGEELNVIVENDTDRPFYEREYMRVDFSRNLITDAYELDTLSQLGIYYGVKWSPVAYYVSDSQHPDAPVFDEARGYFDVTHKAFASPEVIEDEYWGDFPACWLIGYWPVTNCNPSEITLRQSFLRVVDTDYEPLEIDGTMMDMFGWFTVDRFGYDRRYGVVDDQWRRFAARWNLYLRSHPDPVVLCNTPETTPVGADPHRDDDANGTEDECESVGRGSRCDAARGECTIPLRDRTVRTIPWYTNPGFPDDLFEGTKEALAAWSDAIRVGLVAGRLAECRRTGEADCEAQMGWPAFWADDFVPPVGSSSPAEVPEIFVLCHNPVDPGLGDPEVCGPKGTAPRLGDLRYNFLNIFQEPQLLAPWGIMVDAEDPLTGEKIAGSVNQWAHVLDRSASNLVDILAVLNGEIAPTDFIQGEDISQWVKQNQLKGNAEHDYAMSAGELASRREAYDPKVLEPFVAGLPEGKPGTHPKVKRMGRLKALLDTGKLGPGNTALSARLAALRGTGIEATLVSPEMAQAAGFDPTAPISPDAVRRASPFGRMNPTLRRAEQHDHRMARARRHSCRLEAPDADYLLGLARTAQKLFPAPDPNDAAAVVAHRDQVYQWARQKTSAGVMAHELGHSMGLRHNFAASWDSLNYAPQYWQLRTQNGTVTEDCADGTMDGAGCVGPRWRDPLSAAEIDGNIGQYATTSVMDYPGDQNHDMVISGKWDRAAVRFGYGGVLDVWNMDGVSVDGTGAGQEQAYRLSTFAVNPGLFGVYYFTPVDVLAPYEFIHYSQYQNAFGLLGQCSPSDAPDAILGQKCTELPMDVVDYRDMRDFAPDPSYAKFSWAVLPKTVDPAGRVRRGYVFSSDEYADSGNVPAFSYDAGADAYEQVRFLESAYENRYIFDSFRRNSVLFNSWDTTVKAQYRYLDNIQLIAKTWAFGAVLEGDPNQPAEELLADGWYGPLELSGTLALDLFGRILTRADPGFYCPAEFCGGVQPVGVAEPIYVSDIAPLPEEFLYDYEIAVGDGRYLHNEFDYSQGYFWGDYQTQVGSYYDKVWATYYLAEAFDFFISNAKEDFFDSRYKNVNLATIFPAQVKRIYSNIFTGDVSTFAPWALAQANPFETPLANLSYPEWHDPSGFGSRPANALLADPNLGWNVQLYAMVWASIYFPTNWSLAWINDARIVWDGEEPIWSDAETYAFFHPATGIRYRAHRAGLDTVFGRTVQRGIGARALEWANHLVTVAYLVDRDVVTGEPLLNPDGTPILLLDVDGLPQLDPASPGADAHLQKYVDSLDIFRQLTKTFQHPLADEDLPQP